MIKENKLLFVDGEKDGSLNLIANLSNSNDDTPVFRFARSADTKFWYRDINLFFEINNDEKKIVLSTNSNVYKNRYELDNNKERDTLFCDIYNIENAMEAQYTLYYDDDNQITIQFKVIKKADDDIPNTEISVAMEELKQLPSQIHDEINSLCAKVQQEVKAKYGFDEITLESEE